MGTSLKDALLKVGIKPTEKKAAQNERPRPKPAPATPYVAPKKSQDQINQEQRNFCEVCEQICPDVELYFHRNTSLNAKWICIHCADVNMIPDSVRQTMQSDVARKGIFKREFGETRRVVTPQAQQSRPDGRPAQRPHDSGRPGDRTGQYNKGPRGGQNRDRRD